MKLLKEIFKRPLAVAICIVLIFAFGIYAILSMPVALLPKMTLPYVCITTPYVGASAATVDEEVTAPLCDACRSLTDVKNVNSYSIDNASVILIEFDYGVNLDEKMKKLEEVCDNTSLPAACDESTVTNYDLNSSAITTLSMFSTTDDLTDIYYDALALQSSLKNISGVGDVTLTGAPAGRISVATKPDCEVVAPLLVQALAATGQDIPLGNVTNGGAGIPVTSDSALKSIEDVKSLPLSYDVGENAEKLQSLQSMLQLFDETPSESLAEYFGLLEMIYAANPDADMSENMLLALVADSHYAENKEKMLSFRQAHETIDEETGETVLLPIENGEYIDLYLSLAFDQPMLPYDVAAAKGLYAAMLGGIRTSDLSNGRLTLTVGDFADVEVKYDYQSYAYFGTLPAIQIEVYADGDANINAVVSAVESVMKAYVCQYSQSSVVMLDNQSSFITQSISGALSSLLLGGLLAVVIIYLFLRKIKSSLIIAVSMPLSVFASLGCMYLMGITLNMVSLGGLTVGIGMLVDNSIVVLESITSERDKGKSKLQAAVDGTKLVLKSLVGSTITSVCVFFPILFLKGLTREIFADLAWAIIFSLSFSLIVSVTVIPTLYCLTSKKEREIEREKERNEKQTAVQTTMPATSVSASEPEPIVAPPPPTYVTVNAEGVSVVVQAVGAPVATPTEKTEKTVTKTETTPDTPNTPNGEERKEKPTKPAEGRFMNRLKGLYEKALRGVMRQRWCTIVVAAVLFALSVTLVFVTGTEFMPSVDQGQLQLTIDYAADDDIAYCQQKTMEAYKLIEENVENAEYISLSVGSASMRNATLQGKINVQLKDNAKATKDVIEEIRSVFSEKYDLNVSIKELDGIVASLGFVSGAGVSVLGEDPDVLTEISNKIEERVMQKDGFMFVSDNMQEKQYSYVLAFDLQACDKYALNYNNLILSLRIGLSGYAANSITLDGNEIDVVVEWAQDGTGITADELLSYVAGQYNGQNVYLKDVASIKERYGLRTIEKQNGKYVLEILAETSGLDTGTASSVMTDIATDVLKDYEGYSLKGAGISVYLTEAFSGLIVALIISFFLLYGVMAVLFKSFKKPFVVIFSFPFAFAGGFLALAVTGTALSIVSFIGLIMLMGVVVNNAIVLIERYQQLIDSGMESSEAVIEGCKQRLRPILMTSLTTILALIPIALAFGEGGGLMQPLGIIAIGGLALGTLVTLFLIPAVYCLINRIKYKKQDKNKKKTK